MKKIILLFSIVIASVMFYSNYDILNYSNYARITSFPDKILNDVEHTPILINAEKTNNDTILEEFLKQAKEKEVAILYQAHPYSETGYNQYHLYLYNPDNELKVDYYFDEVKDPIDFSKDDTLNYYTSAVDENSYNKIRSYDSSYFVKEGSHIYILPFIQCMNKTYEDEGISMMIYGSESNTLINGVKESLKEVDVEFEWVDLSMNYEIGTYELLEKNEQSGLLLSFMVCFIAILLAYCTQVMKERKKISIYKMHGYSEVAIILKLYKKMYLQMITVFIISYIAWILLKTEINNELFLNLYYQVIKQMLLFIFFIPVLILVTKVYIHYTCSVLSLKNDGNLEKILMINYTLKVMLGIFLITPFINSINQYIPLFKDFKLMSDSEEVIRNNLYLKRPLSYKDREFSNQLLKIGSYCDFDTYSIYSDRNNTFVMNEDGLDKSVYMEHPYIIANENYLRNYVITDENENLVSYEKLQDNTLLVPIEYKENDLKAYLQGVSNDIVYIENNDNMINESARSKTHVLRNPIIRYINEWNTNVVNHCLHLPLTQEKNMDYYINKAIEANVDPGEIAFGYTYADYDYYIVNAKQGIIRLGNIILLYIFIFSLFLYQSIYLYVKKNQKSMAIGYINGQARMERYGEIILLNVCGYAFITMCSITLLHNNVRDTLKFIALFEMFDFVLQFLFLQYYEKQNISTILKGE